MGNAKVISENGIFDRDRFHEARVADLTETENWIFWINL